jgi:hypothetical protein
VIIWALVNTHLGIAADVAQVQLAEVALPKHCILAADLCAFSFHVVGFIWVAKHLSVSKVFIVLAASRPTDLANL